MMENNANILLVDDRRENLLALEAILEAPGLNIFTATSGNQALGLMLEHDFAVVILDVQMPDMDGFEVAELMRKNEKTKFLPIIFVTAFSKDDTYIFKGYETGAVDYLFKPLNPVILKSKVNIFLELDKDKKELEESKKQIEKQNEQLKELSVRDSLTSLYNRRYFQEILKREFSLVKRNHSDISCFMLDLDYFKEVNDTFGHTFGDFVLRRFSQLLKTAIRNTDVLARYGGEEFVLLLPHTNLEGSLILAEKFRTSAEKFIYESGGHSRRVTVSVGISSYNTHKPANAGELVSFADQALYRAKAEGRNQVRIYNEEALIKAGTFISSPSNHLLGIKEQLKKVLEKTTEVALVSLETLIPQPSPPISRQDREEPFSPEHNRRILEIFDMMAERLRLSRALRETFNRTARLHFLLKSLLGEDAPQEEQPPDTEKTEKPREIEDYSLMLDELTHMFNIFAEERSILLHHHENYDKARYLERRGASHIPVAAGLFTLLEAFVTMTDQPQAASPIPPEQVIDRLVSQAGKQLDPQLVRQFLDLIREKGLLPVPKERIQAALAAL